MITLGEEGGHELVAQSVSKRDFSFVKICFLKQDWATRSWSHTRALQVGWRKGDNLEVRRNLLDLELRLPHRYHLMLKPVDIFVVSPPKSPGWRPMSSSYHRVHLHMFENGDWGSDLTDIVWMLIESEPQYDSLILHSLTVSKRSDEVKSPETG